MIMHYFCAYNKIHIKVVLFQILASQLSSLVRLQGVFPELLDAVADRISSEYLHIGLELGLTFDKIKQIRMNHRTNTLEIVRKILREWSAPIQPEKCARRKATIGWLATALLNAGCDIKTLKEFEDRNTDGSRSSVASMDTSRKCYIL